MQPRLLPLSVIAWASLVLSLPVLPEQEEDKAGLPLSTPKHEDESDDSALSRRQPVRWPEWLPPIGKPKPDPGWWTPAADEKFIAVYDRGRNERLAYLGRVGAGNFGYVSGVQSLPDSVGDTAAPCRPICVRKSNKSYSELLEQWRREILEKRMPSSDLQLMNEALFLKYMNGHAAAARPNTWKPHVPQLIAQDGPWELHRGTPMRAAYITYLNGETLGAIQNRLAQAKQTNARSHDHAKLMVKVMRELLATVDWLICLPRPIANADIHLGNVLLHWEKGAAFPDPYSIDFGLAHQVTDDYPEVAWDHAKAAVGHIIDEINPLLSGTGLQWNEEKSAWIWPKNSWSEPKPVKALRKVTEIATRNRMDNVQDARSLRMLLQDLLGELNGVDVNTPSKAQTYGYENFYRKKGVMADSLKKTNNLTPRLYHSRVHILKAKIPGPWTPAKVKIGSDGKPDMSKVKMGEGLWCHFQFCYDSPSGGHRIRF